MSRRIVLGMSIPARRFSDRNLASVHASSRRGIRRHIAARPSDWDRSIESIDRWHGGQARSRRRRAAPRRGRSAGRRARSIRGRLSRIDLRTHSRSQDTLALPRYRTYWIPGFLCKLVPGDGPDGINAVAAVRKVKESPRERCRG